MTSNWCRAYQVCTKSSCHNWIWQDKIRSGNKCRKCGTWWEITSNGKGKGQGHSQQAKTLMKGWPKKSYQEALLDTPPGLSRPRPLRRPKDQQQAAELLTANWESIPDTIQSKLQALGLGPQPQEEPGLTDILKTHMTSLPPEVQAVVTKLTTPLPQTEKEIAQQLKHQVTELKNQSIKKTQLQVKLDQAKSHYAAMLQDMQDIQARLNDGQQKLKQLSDKYMAAVNQAPKPEDLTTDTAAAEPIPMAVESFVTSLGISLTEDQRSQLHGLLKRPNMDGEDPTKRRKTEATATQIHPPLSG